jgi:hypothetical protein
MSNELEVPQANLPAVIDFDADNLDRDRLLENERMYCKDGVWTLNDVEVPRGVKKFWVVATAEGVQHWKDGELIKEIIKKPGVELPNVKALNDAIPPEEWDESDYGPRAPYSHQFAVYLFDEKTGEIITYMNETNGAEIAWRKLRSAIKWKSLMLGYRVRATVTLGQRMVSKKFKKIGPCFNIVADEWRDFHTNAIVKDPPLKDIVRDEIPHQDGPNDPIGDVFDAPKVPNKSQLMSDLHKSVQPEPAHKVTKRGVTTIAGGRGR